MGVTHPLSVPTASGAVVVSVDEIRRLRTVEGAARAFHATWCTRGRETEEIRLGWALEVALGAPPVPAPPHFPAPRRHPSDVGSAGGYPPPPDRGDETCAEADADPLTEARNLQFRADRVRDGNGEGSARITAARIARVAQSIRHLIVCQDAEWFRVLRTGGMEVSTFTAAKHLRDSDLCDWIRELGRAL